MEKSDFYRQKKDREFTPTSIPTKQPVKVCLPPQNFLGFFEFVFMGESLENLELN